MLPFHQVHLGRQEQMRLKTLREMEDLAADAEQARHDKRTFLEEEERENQREIRKHQVWEGFQARYNACVLYWVR